MKLFMAVSADEYELPMCICDSLKELSERMDVKINTLKSDLSKNRKGTRRNFKCVKVILDEEGEK